jgi:hypothetical protein
VLTGELAGPFLSAESSWDGIMAAAIFDDLGDVAGALVTIR